MNVLERFLPPKSYVSQEPENMVDINGKVRPSNYNPDLTVHLNQYRPRWAMGLMLGMIVKKLNLPRESEAVQDLVVTFTVTLWKAGMDDVFYSDVPGDVGLVHFRIITTLKEAHRETEGMCALETAIAKLVKAHVARKQRYRVSRPVDVVTGIDKLKNQIAHNYMTQEGGPTRQEVLTTLTSVQDDLQRMENISE